MKSYQLSDLRPYVVVKVYWSCIEENLENVANSLEFHGFSWMGWLCESPKDWEGVIEDLQSLVPKGAIVKNGTWLPYVLGSEIDPPFTLDLMFPRKPSGLNAPWLPSEETQYYVATSPRICFVDLHWNFKEEIPREFSQKWHDLMSIKALDLTKFTRNFLFKIPV